MPDALRREPVWFTRPMAVVGAPFLLGAVVASLFSRDLGVGLAAGLAAGLFLAAIFLRGKRRAQVFATLAAGLVGCAAFLAWRDNDSHFLPGPDGGVQTLTGGIRELEPLRDGRTRATVWLEPNGPLALVYLPKEVRPGYYDTLTAQGSLLPMGKTPDFDYARALRAQGVQAVVWAQKAEVTPNPHKPPLAAVKEMRDRLRDEVDREFRAPWSGMMRAILLGDSSNSDPLLSNRFQRAGISHLFVVSGLHVSLAAGILLLLFRKLGLRRLAPLGAGAGAWLFVALTGFGVSAMRAGIMMTVVLAAQLFHRPADPLNSLFLAGILLVGSNPGTVWSASFLLTFTAALGAVTLASPLAGWLVKALHIRSRAGKSFCGVAGLTFACNAAMLPLLLTLFGGVSLVSPLANLVAVPLLPLVLAGGALTLASAGAPVVAAFFARGVELFLKIITETARALTEPQAVYLGLDYPWVLVWLLLAGGAAAAAFCLRRKIPGIPARAAGGIAISLVLLLGLQGIFQQGSLEILPVETFDGADAALLHDGKATVLSFMDDGYAGVAAESALRAKNVRMVDNLVFLRADTREPSGETYLAQCLPVGNLILSGEDRFAPYAAKTVPLQNGVYPLGEGTGCGLFSFGDGGCQVRRERDGTLVTLQAGSTRVMFTDSLSLARESNCEILFYAGKSLNPQVPLPAKYVILLKRPQHGALPPNWFSACDGKVSVRLRSDGSYAVRAGPIGLRGKGG